MLLALLCVGLLVAALGLVQAWMVWYLRREVRRLEARMEESLDDEDLGEFQERLQGLITQARETTVELVDLVDKRREALEASLEKIKETEKSLALRALERSGKEPVRAGDTPLPAPAPGTGPRNRAARASGRARPEAEPHREPPSTAAGTGKARASDRPEQPQESPPAEAEGSDEARSREAGESTAERDRDEARSAAARGAELAREAEDEADARRSYLVRPPALPQRYQKIYDMADQGLNRAQIAKSAGMLPGEVDLILNLRRRSPGA